MGQQSFLFQALVCLAAAVIMVPLAKRLGLGSVLGYLLADIAVLMTQVGLSPALGTFLAGGVLANSQYKHELESDIEPFKGLLLGLFFIAVGASINFHLIAAQPWLIFGLVLMLMVIKGLVLFVLGKIFRIGMHQDLLHAAGKP